MEASLGIFFKQDNWFNLLYVLPGETYSTFTSVFISEDEIDIDSLLRKIKYLFLKRKTKIQYFNSLQLKTKSILIFQYSPFWDG